ncbi:efflux RND transporter periplasmic adaptor subunit [Candidatus Nitrosacidococcus sp. I8]|uniref:efflux RND transporter periplasmic adaptor subunit n=1 Tax=Candidatus Nitrosacidococcus sp. I8 TaxID=2942908 RepID=UPI0022275C3A|nr:efflux RND transporter periplasmic adaptor subunit [Candidatus Nitrosacidococcus sp. I8]CAH9017890.1 Cobalt-zinc-cadmium resistance protein CzcB [Candidatus Nitrosacidococcus sp. I8]
MKYNTKYVAILSVIGVGIILGVLILRSGSPSDSVYDQQKIEDFKKDSQKEQGTNSNYPSIHITAETQQKIGIQIKTAGPVIIQSILTLPGEIELNPKKVSDVVSRVDGIATKVYKFIGDKVIKDEILAILESQTLADLRSQYFVALRQLDFAKVIAEREEILWKEKVSAKQDYLAAKIELQKAKILVEAATQKLLALGIPKDQVLDSNIPYNRYELRAPFDGEVIQQNLVLGESASSTSIVFSIADLSTVWGEITIYTRDLKDIQIGHSVMIEATDAGFTTTGTVFYIAPLVGQKTRSTTAYVQIPNPEGYWYPGLFINAKISHKENQTPVAVDRGAIQTYQDHPIIFVQHDGDQFEARSVVLGVKDDQWVEVREGLSAGESYVASNSFILKSELNKFDTMDAAE